MTNYKLLTPGPLTTSPTVKQAMLVDHCTWDEDYKEITQDIRQKLLQIGNFSADEYTCILMQGSGTFGVEAMLTTLTSSQDVVLVITNGKYGERIVDILEYAQRKTIIYEVPYEKVPQAEEIAKLLVAEPQISHVVMVHSETTTGILNDIEAIGKVVKAAGKRFIVDAVSSYGGVLADYSVADALVSSSNKCVEGVPGFSYVIVKKEYIETCENNATTLSLDLYDQYIAMADGKWRFTSPTHAVVAFKQALAELEIEGGVQARSARYQNNQQTLAKGMQDLGFGLYIDPKDQGPIITTFTYPNGEKYDFSKMYNYIKERGYAIYPGKLTDVDTFRIGSIGQVFESDMKNVIAVMRDYLAEEK